MPQPVSLAEAKAFLRVTQDAEDGLLALLLEAAHERLEAALSLTLDDLSPAPLRLAILHLAAHAFEHREAGEPPISLVEPWIAPLADGAAVTLAGMRVFATLQAAAETETACGGRTRAWSDVTDLWVELTVRGAAEPAEGGLRPVFTEDAIAVSHDDPLAAQGQRLLASGDSWRLVRVVRGAPKLGRMTLHLDRVK